MSTTGFNSFVVRLKATFNLSIMLGMPIDIFINIIKEFIFLLLALDNLCLVSFVLV